MIPKTIFLLLALFFLNTASAGIIFQENFESQTTGNFTIMTGIPTFITTPPHGYYLYYDPVTNIGLTNTTIPPFTNFTYDFYIKIDQTTGNYNFNIDLYDNAYNAYVSFLFMNKTGDLNRYSLSCFNGVDFCSGVEINSINLSSHRDINNYVQMQLKMDSGSIKLYINGIINNTYVPDVPFNPVFEINENFINKFQPFAIDEIVITDLDSNTEFTATGIVTFRDMNINSTAYPLNNSLVMVNETKYDYTDSSGAYSISGLPNGVYALTISKIGFGTITGATSNTSPIQNFLLNFSQPFMTLPHIENGTKILSEYNNTEYPLNLWNSPNFVWGVYRFIEFNGTEKDIDYFKPCTHASGATFQCELVLNKDYKFKIMYSDIYNYNLGIYHPFLTGSRNFTTNEITISKDIKEINTIKTISTMSQADREVTFKNYFWEAVFYMFIILFFGFILTGGKRI